MADQYDDAQSAANYRKFLASDHGRQQMEFLRQNILPQLGANRDVSVLDAACGDGWLAGELAGKFSSVQAFDISTFLIAEARRNHPNLDFKVADLEDDIPYDDESFDYVVLNMAAHDVANLDQALVNLVRVLKPKGRLIMTVANPYYAFPVGEWKRGWRMFIPGMKPVLRLRPYNQFKRWNKKEVTSRGRGELSYFYSLGDYINKATDAGLHLTSFQELEAAEDSSNFDLSYQLHRFPIILLMVFAKKA